MNSAMNFKDTRSLLLPIFCALLFAVAYVQSPLYSSNQNTYFLPGLAHSGFGFLAGDWLARQTDAMPVFSLLVESVVRLGYPWLFHVILAVLAAAYAGALLVIVASVTDRYARPKLLLFMLGLILLNCSWLFNSVYNWVHVPYSFVSYFQLVAGLATNGVAGQYILGSFLQPSAFGVFLIVGMALFLRDQVNLAAVAYALAATMHPTYALHAACLVLFGTIALIQEGQKRRAFTFGVIAAVLIAPIVAYVASYLGPTNGDALATAQKILVEERIPHHAKVSVWFGKEVIFQLAIALLALAVARDSRRLFIMLVGCLSISVALTLLVALTHHNGLALVFPWRMSAWLVPVCSALWLWRVIGALPGKVFESRVTCGRLMAFGCLFFIVLAAGLGIKRTLAVKREEVDEKVIECEIAMPQKSEVFLVPLEFENFRMATGMPIFVDFKSHPYKDVQVIEWAERVKLVRKFYAASDPQELAGALNNIYERQDISAIVDRVSRVEKLGALGFYMKKTCGDYAVFGRSLASL